MRVSRWVRSPYETEEDIRSERALLGGLVEVVDEERDAEIVVVSSSRRVDAAMLDAAPSCRLVLTTTSGSDHLDLPELARRSIVAARLPLARRDAVVDAALMGLLAGLRRAGTLRARAAEGRWARAELPSLGAIQLNRATVGLVGLGVIGRRLAEVLEGLGASVMGCDPLGVPPGVVEAGPEEMFETCDAVSLHCDLNPTTRGLVDADLLSVSRGLVLVNTARGPLVDVPAAIEALDAGRLASLSLDVFGDEPYPDMRAVLGRPELWLSPHAAGYHADLALLVRQGLYEAIDALVRGASIPFEVRGW